MIMIGNDQRRRGRRLGNEGQPLEPQNNNNNNLDPHDNDDFEHGGGRYRWNQPLNHNPHRRSFFYWNDPFLWLPFPVSLAHCCSINRFANDMYFTREVVVTAVEVVAVAHLRRADLTLIARKTVESYCSWSSS